MGFKTLTQFINPRPIFDMSIVHVPYMPLFVNGTVPNNESNNIVPKNVTIQEELSEEPLVETIDPDIISERDLKL